MSEFPGLNNKCITVLCQSEMRCCSIFSYTYCKIILYIIFKEVESQVFSELFYFMNSTVLYANNSFATNFVYVEIFEKERTPQSGLSQTPCFKTQHRVKFGHEYLRETKVHVCFYDFLLKTPFVTPQ